MSNLVPSEHTLPILGGLTGGSSLSREDRRAVRQLQQIRRQTAIRSAAVVGHSIVQNEKVHEVDRLARTAMAGQAMLNRWAATLAAGDPFIADEMKVFSDIAKLGKAQVLADTVDDFGREGRS